MIDLESAAKGRATLAAKREEKRNSDLDHIRMDDVARLRLSRGEQRDVQLVIASYCTEEHELGELLDALGLYTRTGLEAT